MIVDKPEHKQVLLAIIKMGQFSGEHIDLLYELKKSIENSEVMLPTSFDEEKEY